MSNNDTEYTWNMNKEVMANTKHTIFFWQTGKILWLLVQKPKAAHPFGQSEHVNSPISETN